jgi:hypothetical protein
MGKEIWAELNHLLMIYRASRGKAENLVFFPVCVIFYLKIIAVYILDFSLHHHSLMILLQFWCNPLYILQCMTILLNRMTPISFLLIKLFGIHHDSLFDMIYRSLLLREAW